MYYERHCHLSPAPLALAVAVAVALGSPWVHAAPADCSVTVSTDDGAGATPGTLSWAILTANTNVISSNGHPGGGCIDNTITLKTDVTVTGVMKRLIDSNMTLTSDAASCTHSGRCTIDGGNAYRPLFVKSGSVIIQNLNFANGVAQGGAGYQPGAGAGLGGALFVYSGAVTLQHVDFSNNVAHGGNGNGDLWAGGGSGMLGIGANGGGGGGLFASAADNSGGYGGTGNYGGGAGAFGGGGNFGGTGGFGGGGGVLAGHGGFGGGGGLIGSGTGGAGGFGGGGGYGVGSNSQAGFGAGFGAGHFSGAGGGAGAGLGGAVFVKKGALILKAVSFTHNTAQGGSGHASNDGSGMGGGLFVCTSNLDSDSSAAGANGGCSASIDEIQSCGVSFSSNTALTAAGGNTANGEPDLFWNNNGSQQGASGISDPCFTTTTALASDHNPSIYGESVTFTATVNPAPDGGTVAFKDGSTDIGGCATQGLDSSGNATCSTSTLATGSHAITALYSGSPSYGASTGVLASGQTVNQAGSTTSITGHSPDPSAPGSAVTVNYSVNPSQVGVTPTGNVTVSDGATSCTATVAAGKCDITLNALGDHTLTATYAGDVNVTGSASAGVTQHVRATSITGDNPVGSGQITVTLNNGSSSCGFDSAQFSAPGDAPSGWVLPFGLFSFHADGCATGGPLTLVFNYPGALPAGAIFGKFGPTQNQPAHWYSLPASISGSQLTVTLTDGGAGDSDLAADGQFTDPGGAVYMVGASAIPTLPNWALVLMAMLLGGAGWVVNRGRSVTPHRFG